MQILDVAQKTCQKQWTIGRNSERESEISVLIVQHDDDDDDDERPAGLATLKSSDRTKQSVCG